VGGFVEARPIERLAFRHQLPEHSFDSDIRATIAFEPPVMPAGLERRYGLKQLHFITFSCRQRQPFLKTAEARDLFLKIL
jgi:hypothetical protein